MPALLICVASQAQTNVTPSSNAVVQATAPKRLVDSAAMKSELGRIQGRRYFIFARVIQKMDKGLLVSASEGASEGPGYQLTPEYEKLKDTLSKEAYWNVPRAKGTILLLDHPKPAAAGERFVTVAYEVGTFSYSSGTNAPQTIRKYTADPVRWVYGPPGSPLAPKR